MKLIISITLSFILGLGAMYLILGKLFSTIGQMSSETQLDTQIKYLELLEENRIEPLKEILRRSIDCGSAVYENNLTNFLWEKTSYSKKNARKI